MSQLMAKFVKHGNIWTRIYFIFVKSMIKQLLEILEIEILLIPNVNVSEKVPKAAFKSGKF